MVVNLATYLSVICLALSALAWTVSAAASPIIEQSYWDRLPNGLILRQKVAGWANMAAALLSAAGVFFQAYASSAALS